MTFRHMATLFLVATTAYASAALADSACATLVGATQTTPPQGFQVRDGEPVDLVRDAQTVHGTLRVFGDGGAFRVYWQPDNSPEKYVLANAGINSVRLVATPPQGVPAKNGEPGMTLEPQRVLSCPTL
ncbi:MAG TPA: hypothetical protein VFE79_15855 [Paraburkholderia sp.]|nr:hypothetical protein [Paraburkholderia sp.]